MVLELSLDKNVLTRIDDKDIYVAIRLAAVKYDAYNPEQIVSLLQGCVTSAEEADLIVKSMLDNPDVYGSLFIGHVHGASF